MGGDTDFFIEFLLKVYAGVVYFRWIHTYVSIHKFTHTNRASSLLLEAGRFFLAPSVGVEASVGGSLLTIHRQWPPLQLMIILITAQFAFFKKINKFWK